MENFENHFIRSGGSFSIEERHSLIKEYLAGDLTKTEKTLGVSVRKSQIPSNKDLEGTA